ncbi:MAG: hypothetical protein ABJG47_12180 [Ekhidna sp.]
MKPSKLFLPVFIAIAILGSSCQEDDSLENGIHSGKLKRIITRVSTTASSSSVSEYVYDEEGRISKVSLSTYEGEEIVKLFNYDLYTYNSQGQLEGIQHFSANNNSPSGFISLINYTYAYSNDGKKEKEHREYPQLSSSDYSLFKYENDVLSIIEKYEKDSDELEYYILNKYNDSGNLVRETKFSRDSTPFWYEQHSFENGLNVRTDVFGYPGLEPVETHLKEIIKTYDENNNLAIRELRELYPFNSGFSRFKYYSYEYYE